MLSDLRSDTVTRPSPGMMQAMMNAKLGDDVFGDDPTVNELEKKCSSMFNMEAAVFCPSGTMTNQIAIKTHTQPGDEVICEYSAHVYRYEGGGMAFNSGVSVRPIIGDRGILNPEDIVPNINPDNTHYPVTRLVTLENTSNRGGGAIYSFDRMKAISDICRKNNLNIHLDGARLFNAIIETKDKLTDIAGLFDSISVCFSKGLGTPAGSILIGTNEFIKKARRIRKVLGGAMRQSGILASAALYALNHNIIRLKEDHIRAKKIGACLQQLNYVEKLLPVDTNIVIFNLKSEYPSATFIDFLEKNNIKAVIIGSQQIRFVTHLDFMDEQLEGTIAVLRKFSV